MDKTGTSTTAADAFKIILKKIVHEKMNNKTHEDTILVALSEVMTFIQKIIDQLETAGESPHVSCTSGCSFCCHNLIQVIPVEALLISNHINLHYIDSDIQKLKTDINRYQRLIKGKGFQERVSIKALTPCIFLKDDTCGIYQVRPMICRAWNSLDQSVCRSAFFTGNYNAEIETSPMRNFMFSTAREIFQEMDSQMALKTGLYDIPGAIIDCLTHHDSLARWCANLPVFTE